MNASQGKLRTPKPKLGKNSKNFGPDKGIGHNKYKNQWVISLSFFRDGIDFALIWVSRDLEVFMKINEVKNELKNYRGFSGVFLLAAFLVVLTPWSAFGRDFRVDPVLQKRLNIQLLASEEEDNEDAAVLEEVPVDEERFRDAIDAAREEEGEPEEQPGEEESHELVAGRIYDFGVHRVAIPDRPQGQVVADPDYLAGRRLIPEPVPPSEVAPPAEEGGDVVVGDPLDVPGVDQAGEFNNDSEPGELYFSGSGGCSLLFSRGFMGHSNSVNGLFLALFLIMPLFLRKTLKFLG